MAPILPCPISEYYQHVSLLIHQSKPFNTDFTVHKYGSTSGVILIFQPHFKLLISPLCIKIIHILGWDAKLKRHFYPLTNILGGVTFSIEVWQCEKLGPIIWSEDTLRGSVRPVSSAQLVRQVRASHTAWHFPALFIHPSVSLNKVFP